MDLKDKQNDIDDDQTSAAQDDNQGDARKDDTSAVSDLLHVFGFSSGKKKKSSDSQPKITEPSEPHQDLYDHRDDSLPVEPEDDDSERNGSSDYIEELLEEPEELGEDTPDGGKRQRRLRKTVLVGAVALLVAAGLFFSWPFITEPRPPGTDAVGSYNGRVITIEELKSFIALEQAKESVHSVCPIHGEDHTLCDQSEECEEHPIDSLEGYQQMVKFLAIEQIIQDWADAQGVTQRENVQHEMNDLLDDASVSQYVSQLHEEQITPESISSLEVQQYYDKNKALYGSRPLSEVEKEIRRILVEQKDEEFFPQYIEELKKTAGLEVDFDLLKVTDPTDKEIEAYYKQNVSLFQTAEKAEALEIRIDTGDVQYRAAEAVGKLSSGENFDSVAAAYGKTGKALELLLEKGKVEGALEAAIWKMKPGDISEQISNADGSVSIVKLLSISAGGTKPLSEVREEIRSTLLTQNMEKEYTIRKDEALFSVHSRRYTLGDFYTEFKELTPEYQALFSTFDTKQQLVEQMIAKELLLEENGDDSADKSEQHDTEELKIQYLSQILHQEEVDNKLADPSENEIKDYYNKNKKDMIVPRSVIVSLIYISNGQQGETAEQAQKNIVEAWNQVKNGADFAEIARKYSEDSSAESGGEFPEALYEDHLPEELATKLFSLKVGEISNVINYTDGYYIFKVRERVEKRQQTYEEAAEGIKSYLKDKKHSDLETGLEEVLLKNVNFTIFDKTLRKMLKAQNNA